MIFQETETYTLNGKKQELPGFDKAYVNFVDYILKITEDIWEKRAVWLIYDTYGEDVTVDVGARTLRGIETVVSGTVSTLYSFPDRTMFGEAVIWSKIGDNHFYSSHRIASTATNEGPTQYGPATGKKVQFRTIADCLATENKIVEEWLARDNMHLVMQLGFDPVVEAKKDQRYADMDIEITEAVTRNAIVKNGKPYDLDNPAELILSLYNDVWASRNFAALDQYYHELAKVHMICDNDLTGPRKTAAYLKRLFASFPDAAVQIERVSTNEIVDGYEVAARWRIMGKHTEKGFFEHPNGQTVNILGISHYIVNDGKIAEEWMIFDAFDTLCQIFKEEKTALSEGVKSGSGEHLTNKKMVFAFLQEKDKFVSSSAKAKNVLQKYLYEDVCLEIAKPFDGVMKGVDAYNDDFWQPLLAAFPDVEDQPYILLGGSYEGRDYVSATGNLIGTFQKDWLGIPATNQPTYLRYSATFLIEKGKIAKVWYFFDMLDVMRQAGFNFIPNKGLEWIPPAPMTGDGIVTYTTNPAEGQKSIDLTNAMLDGLGEYDGKTLESMAQERFWDEKDMMWYGPSGIGTTRGLKGFQDNHQIPFLEGFPDRGITPKIGKDYFAQIGDGNYSCDFGFPAMYGTHNGDGWLGLKATGKKITLRVVDYWRREGDKLKENWVFIDMVDILEQLGVDVFDLLAKARKM
ncbi:MAG: ester cyclase [Bacteroidota bacterium]